MLVVCPLSMEKWRIIVFLYGAVHSTVVLSAPPSPVNVVFSSVNLRNVLHWHHGNGTPPGTLFNVRYAIYGDSVEGSRGKRMHWRVVQPCKDLQHNWCDLTNETWDLEEGYYAKVRAVSKRQSSNWTTTKRFHPKSDTTFGPPLVSVVMDGNSAVIHLKGPMRYMPESHAPEVSMATIYPNVKYELFVRNTRRNKTSNFLVSSRYHYRLMEYDTEYCFSAKTRFQLMSFISQPSAWHCFTTPQDPVIGQMQRVIVGIVVPGMCVCIVGVIGYFLYRSLRGIEHKRPHTLVELAHLHVMPRMFSPEEIKPQEAYFLLPCTNVPPDLLNYASQKPAEVTGTPRPPPPARNASWEGNAFAEREEVDYGCVVVKAVAPEGSGEERRGEERRGRSQAQREAEKDRTWWGGGSSRPTGVPTAPINSYLPQETPGLSAVYPPDGETWSEGERGALEGEAEESGDPPGTFLNGFPDLFCHPVHLNTRQSQDMPTPYAGQSGAFGLLSAAAEEDGNNDGGILLLNWIPEAARLAFPGRGDGGWESGRRGEAATAHPQAELLLNSVFVRQASEEGRETEGETGCEADTLLDNWDLVVTMEE